LYLWYLPSLQSFFSCLELKQASEVVLLQEVKDGNRLMKGSSLLMLDTLVPIFIKSS
jgi:hypothetical protein